MHSPPLALLLSTKLVLLSLRPPNKAFPPILLLLSPNENAPELVLLVFVFPNKPPPPPAAVLVFPPKLNPPVAAGVLAVFPKLNPEPAGFAWSVLLPNKLLLLVALLLPNKFDELVLALFVFPNRPPDDVLLAGVAVFPKENPPLAFVFPKDVKSGFLRIQFSAQNQVINLNSDPFGSKKI